ncbi:MAG: hypothetical protein CME34_08440 [Gordonia sp.]|nr:hypothetical protein [Gordonia sp. (in: high G+C Gram-positive bacteria)]
MGDLLSNIPGGWRFVDQVTARCRRCGQRVATLPIEIEDLPDQSVVYRVMVGIAKSRGWQMELACTCDAPPRLPDHRTLILQAKRHTRNGKLMSFTIRV